MKQEIKKYILTMFDTPYTIRSDEPEHRVRVAAEQVDFYMKEIAQGAPGLDQKTIAVLAVLKLASRMTFLELAMQENEQQARDLAEKITAELSAPHCLDE